MGDYMKKIAFMADVHANIDALNLVLEDMERKNVDEIICLGDLVTKYFYPREVVDAIKNNCSIVIRGNCDEFVAHDERYVFARFELGLDNIDYLANLPFKHSMMINDKSVNLYHATPNSIDDLFNPLFKGNYYSEYRDKIIYDYKELFEDNQISIVGHTHQSYIGIEEKGLLNTNNLETELADKRMIINVGSAGEHNYMVLTSKGVEPIIDPYLTYIIIDDKAKIIKVPYKETLKKVYIDMVNRQIDGTIPPSPKDTKKLIKSLKLM